jgi:hypothetical protein
MESPACDLKDAIYIGRLSHASHVVNVASQLARLLGGVHYMLKDTMWSNMLTDFGIKPNVLRIASNFSYDLEVRFRGVIFLYDLFDLMIFLIKRV